MILMKYILVVQEDTAVCLAVLQYGDDYVTIGREYIIACCTSNTITLPTSTQPLLILFPRSVHNSFTHPMRDHNFSISYH
jgi:hypothetical protein